MNKIWSFLRKQSSSDNEEKTILKKFDILKYDALRAMRIGKYDYALKCFTAALELGWDVETVSSLAQLLILTNQLEEARILLVRAVEKDPSNIPFRLTIARVYAMLCDYPAMEQAAREVLAQCPDHADACFLIAQARYMVSDMEGSLSFLTRALSLRTGYLDALLLRANVYAQTGNKKSALEDIRTALIIDPHEETALLLRADILIMEGETNLAIGDYNLLLECNPFCTKAYLGLGGLYADLKDTTQAMEVYNQGIENNPLCAELYIQRGNLKRVLGDETGAHTDLSKGDELMKEESLAFDQSPQSRLSEQKDILGL